MIYRDIHSCLHPKDTRDDLPTKKEMDITIKVKSDMVMTTDGLEFTDLLIGKGVTKLKMPLSWVKVKEAIKPGRKVVRTIARV